MQVIFLLHTDLLVHISDLPNPGLLLLPHIPSPSFYPVVSFLQPASLVGWLPSLCICAASLIVMHPHRVWGCMGMIMSGVCVCVSIVSLERVMLDDSQYSPQPAHDRPQAASDLRLYIRKEFVPVCTLGFQAAWGAIMG